MGTAAKPVRVCGDKGGIRQRGQAAHLGRFSAWGPAASAVLKSRVRKHNKEITEARGSAVKEISPHWTGRNTRME